jgi:hypothetical protein
MSAKVIFKVAVAFMASGAMASANQVINFDDLPGFGPASIPAVYDGFDWNNFGYLNSADYTTTYAPGGSGYLNGTVSLPNVAFNDNSSVNTITGVTVSGSFSSGTAFNLTSAYVTAAWYNELSLEVIGYNGATPVYDKTYTVNTTGPSLIDFNFDGITSVDFVSSGGVLAGLSGTIGTGGS